ncbi:MurR/RpiR family transcriptional regulator [Natronoglycomyces albus]|uniref:MurR/RpiR family transcriptional regulator n=1 Tax=Natronoglycomyces albus TaxID=2811108 RepID=A0A895XMV9_9ACTN|nr:MurR/RpiR family transcriptional regulator [Natronoglycomyces albus]QSB04365.1 MurR/RpiR family transcriptional regulator [Natronoglycomyces albus]
MSERHTDTPNLLVLIKSLLPSLSKAEARVAQAIIRDPAAAASRTITELAAEAGASEATVVRFCRSLGLAGHRELRLRAAQAIISTEAGPDREIIGGDIPTGADMSRIIATVAYADAHAITDTTQALDADECERVVDALLYAKRIDVFGAGASGVVAADLTQKLHRIGCGVSFWPDIHAALTGTALLNAKDVAIGISHSGATTETVDFLELARDSSATTVAITNHSRSPLAEVADFVLTTSARETTFRSGATVSRIAQLMVVDCVFVGLASRRHRKSTNALAVTAAAVSDRQRPSRR